MAPTSKGGPHRQRAGASRMARAFTSRGLGLFAETIVVSLAVAILALPAVTVLPALAVGSAHLRRHVEGESDSLAALGRDFVRAMARGWLWGAGVALGYAAIVVTLTSPSAQAVPGGAAFRWLSLGIGAAAAVVLLRASAEWMPGARWSALIRGAADETWRDPSGSLLLLLALALSGVIVWMFAPLVVLAPGLLVLATLAVSTRRRAVRAGAPQR